VAEGPPAGTRGVGLRDEQPVFVRLGRHSSEDALPLSGQAVHKLVRRDCLGAAVPERLAHPHALRSYWATHLLEAGVAVHVVSARLGHADLRTTSRYAAMPPTARKPSTTSPTSSTAAISSRDAEPAGFSPLATLRPTAWALVDKGSASSAPWVPSWLASIRWIRDAGNVGGTARALALPEWT